MEIFSLLISKSEFFFLNVFFIDIYILLRYMNLNYDFSSYVKNL